MIGPGQHVVLVGMMGTGKSTVARLLALRLGREVLDTDHEIERRTGRTVRSIFNDDGEASFRQLESQVLAEALASEQPLVIAAAGGVVVSEVNRASLKASGARVVWLCADAATLIERVRSGPHRPLLDADPEGTLRRMVTERAPWYREVADVIVLVDHRSANDVVEAVLR